MNIQIKMHSHVDTYNFLSLYSTVDYPLENIEDP